MKKIINGKMYDTETAELLGSTSYSNTTDFRHYAEELYRKRTGEFFLYGEGGPLSAYAEEVSLNEWRGGELIDPLTPAEARDWAEKNLDADEYEKIFGEVEEDDSKVVTSLSLSRRAYELAKVKAAEHGYSMSKYINDLILLEK